MENARILPLDCGGEEKNAGGDVIRASSLVPASFLADKKKKTSHFLTGRRMWRSGQVWIARRETQGGDGSPRIGPGRWQVCCPRGPEVSKGHCCVLTASPSAPCAVWPVRTGTEQVPSLGQHSQSPVERLGCPVHPQHTATLVSLLSLTRQKMTPSERNFTLHNSKPWDFGS